MHDPLAIPDFLRVTTPGRSSTWDKMALTTVPLFTAVPRTETAETAAFRAQVEEQRRIKALNQIAKMKERFAVKAIDYSKVRWNSRKNRWEDIKHVSHSAIPAPRVATERTGPVHLPKLQSKRVDQRAGKGEAQVSGDWSRLNKNNAEAIAKLNGVWKDNYDKLRGTGRITMTVGNVLKGLVKKGGEVRWQ